jgi:protein SCO1/2
MSHRAANPFARFAAMFATAAALLVGGLAVPAAAQGPRTGFDPTKPAAGPLNLSTPADLKGLDVIERLGEKVPLDLTFYNTLGQEVRLGDYFFRDHRPVVLAMVYFRCPMQCPFMLRQMVRRFNELDLTIGEQYNVVVVSFDPTENHDSARQQASVSMAAYNREVASDPAKLAESWAFLTGPAQHSATLAKALGFPYRFLPYSGEYSHPAVIFVLTPDGTIARYLYGVDFPTDRLRMSLLEASDGRIGSSWDRFVLWCYHFDPTKGEYVLAAFRVMQIGTVASALVMAVFLGVMWVWVERRRRNWRSFGVAAGAGKAGERGGAGAVAGG